MSNSDEENWPEPGEMFDPPTGSLRNLQQQISKANIKNPLLSALIVQSQTKSSIQMLKMLLKTVESLPGQTLEDTMLARRLQNIIAALECYQNYKDNSVERHRLQQILHGDPEDHL